MSCRIVGSEVPVYTESPAAYRSDADFWSQLSTLDDAELHVWHDVTPFPGAGVDVLLADLSTGVFCIAVKAMSADDIRHVDQQSLARLNGSVGPSPFSQSVACARALAVHLDRTWEERPDLIPAVAFPRITRADWNTKFAGDAARGYADYTILQDDLANVSSLRARLNTIAAKPVAGRRRATDFEGLPEETVEHLRDSFATIVRAGGAGGAGRATEETPILAILQDVIGLVSGPGAHYGSPGADALVRWLAALEDLSPRLRVSVVGEFKAGKSTLINAIFGRDVCFVDDFEATSVAATYTPGDGDGVMLLSGDGSFAACTLPDFLAACANRETSGIKRAVVTLPSDLPFDLTDTPGLGSQTEDHDDRAEEAIRRTDLVLWAVDCNDAGSAREGAFIQRAREIGLPILVLLTKADTLASGDLRQLEDYVTKETGVAAKDIFPVSAHRQRDGVDPGIEALMARLRQASSERAEYQRDAYAARVREAAAAANSVLRYLLEVNAPHARFLAAESGYLESGAAGIGRIGKAEWLRLLREECGEVAKSLEVHSVEDAKVVEIVLGQTLPGAVERATARFLQNIRSLVRDEWRGALEERSREFERRIAELVVARPEAKADLEFLRTQRDEFKRRADVIASETDSSGIGGRLLVVGIGAAASMLMVSFVPIAVAGVVAGLGVLDPKGRGRTVVASDSVIAARIEDALVNSFEQIADSVERAIERIVGDVAIRSLIRLVKLRGGPDFYTILAVERKAWDLMDDLAAIL